MYHKFFFNLLWFWSYQLLKFCEFVASAASSHLQIIRNGWKPHFLTNFAQQSVNSYVFMAKKFKNAVKLDKK